MKEKDNLNVNEISIDLLVLFATEISIGSKRIEKQMTKNKYRINTEYRMRQFWMNDFSTRTSSSCSSSVQRVNMRDLSFLL